MEEKKATIKTIAAELGVSVSTVSKALNNDPSINIQTRQLISEKAIDLNYRPNYIARSLKKRRTNTIGIILSDIENPIHMNMIRRISNDLSKFGYTMLVADSQFDVVIEERNIHSMLERIPDSIIISPAESNGKNIRLLASACDKLIILDKTNNSLPANYVYVDNEKAGFEAASVLLQNGHRRNLIITTPLPYPGTDDYINGIKRAYAKASVEFDDYWLAQCIPSIEEGQRVFSEYYEAGLSDRSKTFTGILTFCDFLAFGSYKDIISRGLSVPNDFSIVGYDDNPLSFLTTPALTTMHLPKDDIAFMCSSILIAMLMNNDRNFRSYALKPNLVIRDSVRNIDSIKKLTKQESS